MDATTKPTPSTLGPTCDCHVHVIGPYDRYPLIGWRSYTPPEATADDLITLMRRMQLARAVIVQPSILGQDNRCTLDAVAQVQRAGLDARAVAVLDTMHSGSELDALHQSGVRGLRVNLQSQLGGDLDSARRALVQAADQALRHGWHVQLFVKRDVIHALLPTLRALPVPLVLDHFADLSPEGWDDAASASVLDLLGSGRAWIKLSGTYRVGRHAFDERIAPLARQLARVNAERLVWASDWPHTPAHQGQPSADPPVQAYRDIDTHQLMQSVHDWFDAALANRVLSENPASLYGFAA
jgi:predicted TIM-barrel fold metal-dependent hydrolase